MKKTSIIFICLLQAINILAQEREFTINGRFPTSYYDGLTVYLSEIDYKDTNSVFKRDSVTIEGSKFTFKGVIENPIALRYITIPQNEEMAAIIILEEGTIELEMAEVPQMSGTVKNDELRDFTNAQLKNQKELEEILEKAQSLHRIGRLDESMASTMEQNFIDQKTLMGKDVYSFISKNILNEIGEFFFTIYAHNLAVPDLEKLYASSNEKFQKGFVVKSLMNQHVWSLGELRVGKKMKGLDMKNLEGTIEDISLHFEKGKVVLVDFWASWCGPCIKSMPALVKLHDRYQDSGFEIVGISLDSSESAWRTAIKRFGMNWPQYIDDGDGWNGTAAKEYNVTRIPQTYLLDKEGKIVGKDLSGIALIEKIEELLKAE